MALFAQERDISMFRHLSRELMGNIITQQCIYYKFILSKSNVNIYGEATDGGNGRNFAAPVILTCLTDRGDQAWPTSDLGVDLKRPIQFAFLRDDMVDANVVAESGDVILFQEGYYEVDSVTTNQLAGGKDPDFNNQPNPLNPGLELYGWNVSIITKCHYVPSDKYNLLKSRL